MTGATQKANEIILPMPHTGQRVVLSQAKRFNWLAAGRRWRKTTLVMAISVEASLKRKRIIWGAPTYDQVRVGWAETKKAVTTYADFNQSQMTVTFPGGGQILYRSLDDPDNVRSHTADGLVIDEAGDVKEIAWYEVLRPMLMDTNGWAWLIGTPKGRNWFWKEHVKAIGSQDSNSWQVPTVGCTITPDGLSRTPHPLENPFVPFEEIQKLYETMPERSFRQEVLAEFIEDAGGVFRGTRLIATESIRQPYPGDFVAGLDWAQQNDFTVLIVFDANTGKMVDIDRFNQVSWSLQRGRVKAMCDKWNISYLLAESNSIGSPNIEALQAEGLPVVGFETTAVSKSPLIESWALAIEKGETAILNDPVLIAEHEAYERTTSRMTGRSQYSAPPGGHDDTVIASALGWKACTEGNVRVRRL